MHRLAAGFIAGTLATLPMTLVMVILHKLFVGGDEESLPPYKVTMQVSDKLGLWHHLLGDESRTSLALLAHFAYGGVGGIVYGAAQSLLRLPAALTGVLYAVLFWAGHYFGGLPALGLYPHKDRADRQAVMAVAHLVWGAALAAVWIRLVRREADSA